MTKRENLTATGFFALLTLLSVGGVVTVIMMTGAAANFLYWIIATFLSIAATVFFAIRWYRLREVPFTSPAKAGVLFQLARRS